MKIVKVTYTTREEYAPQNSANIRQVMEDLKKTGSKGIAYNVCLSPNGKTFTHTAFFDSDEANRSLLDLPSFKHFQEQLKASQPEAPPQQEFLTLVGSSYPILGNI